MPHLTKLILLDNNNTKCIKKCNQTVTYIYRGTE